MGGVLEQRVAAQPHKGKHAKRKQGDGHHNDFCCRRQMEPHQFRVAHQYQQDDGLHGVARLQQAAQQLAGVRVVGRYGIYIAVFSFVSHFDLLVRPPRR